MVPDMDFEALLVRGSMKKVVETDLRWHVDRVLRVGVGDDEQNGLGTDRFTSPKLRSEQENLSPLLSDEA